MVVIHMTIVILPKRPVNMCDRHAGNALRMRPTGGSRFNQTIHGRFAGVGLLALFFACERDPDHPAGWFGGSMGRHIYMNGLGCDYYVCPRRRRNSCAMQSKHLGSAWWLLANAGLTTGKISMSPATNKRALESKT